MEIKLRSQALYCMKGYTSCVIGKEYMPPVGKDFPAQCFKCGDFDYVYKNTTDYVRHVLDGIDISNCTQRVLVDVKVHDLDVGIIPALPHWHIDCCVNPLEKPPASKHTLFIGGDDSCLTQFLDRDYWYYIPERGTVYWEKILEQGARKHFSSIKPNTLVSYDEHLHRAVPSIRKTKRLLIRVTETSIYLPQNKPFKVTYANSK